MFMIKDRKKIRIIVIVACCVMISATILSVKIIHNNKSDNKIKQADEKDQEVALDVNKITNKSQNIDKGDTDSNANRQPSDPKKKLSSGMTLLEAKKMINQTIKDMEDRGYKVYQFKDLLEAQARDLGSTYDEIDRCPLEENLEISNENSKNSNNSQNVKSQIADKDTTSKQTNSETNINNGATTPQQHAATQSAAPPPSSGRVVSFKDKTLESLIRNAINKSTGDIYSSDVEKITELNNGPFGDAITNLAGIENLVNLTSLSLESTRNMYTLNAIRGLTKLRYLDVKDSYINDISALKGLTNLEHLDLGMSHTGIDDINTLKGLSKLKYINLQDNAIVISDENRKSLQSALPKCTIVF